MSKLVEYAFEDSVAIIRMDDGKANAMSYAMLADINAALDHAELDEAKAIVIVGRDGKFSAGFDLSIMGQGRDAAADLLNEGSRLALRLYELPASLVLGVTGHALAMGALLLLTADERIGAQGPFKVGLNEVKIGMAMPAMGVQLAEDRNARRFVTTAVVNAELFTPSEAIAVRFIDRVVDLEHVPTVAIAMAKTLAADLHSNALAETKIRLRANRAANIRRIISESTSV